MPKLAWKQVGTDKARIRCPGFPLTGALIHAGAGKAGASDSFFVGAPAGGRQAWQRYRPGVRGMDRSGGSHPTQIGRGDKPTSRCVGPDGRCAAERRRQKCRACWRPILQRIGHLASDRKNSALSTFDNRVLPGSFRGGTRPTDAATIQQASLAAAPRGRRKEGWCKRR
jgi:hypothetical protein